jgi:hypothetical protein
VALPLSEVLVPGTLVAAPVLTGDALLLAPTGTAVFVLVQLRNRRSTWIVVGLLTLLAIRPWAPGWDTVPLGLLGTAVPTLAGRYVAARRRITPAWTRTAGAPRRRCGSPGCRPSTGCADWSGCCGRPIRTPTGRSARRPPSERRTPCPTCRSSSTPRRPPEELVGQVKVAADGHTVLSRSAARGLVGTSGGAARPGPGSTC